MSQALRKLTAVVARSNTCLIFINQIREKIGVMFGNPETTTGGRALKFYSSVRLEIRRTSSIKDGDSVVGNRTKVKVVKNKVAPPSRNPIRLMYARAFQRSVAGSAVGIDSEKRRGCMLSSDRLGHGRENAKNLLQSDAGMPFESKPRCGGRSGSPPRREPSSAHHSLTPFL